ncbi:MAG: aminotransferase class I/II-fold pyridoxal phosphate-dependent enzyme [Prevotella sp.]|nr:aminotransferase class I/II-fold pyridoxal phosphate-dependent enzyme [Prevotella sp.]MDE7089289.1 aminotransferase class I/II-fold pyridoxal phosphate-dependent enzyme [Prevotella sp.]
MVDNEQLLKQYYSRYGGFWVYPDMLDYCYLVNPYFNRSKIIDEMQDNFRTLVSEYPAGMRVNSMLASECWNVRQDYIIPGNGAAELIKALMENLEGKIGVVRPTFEEYPNRLADERVVTFIPQNDTFRYDADDLIAFFGQNHVDNLLLINPDNPSGNFVSVKGIHKVAQWCEDNDIRFILDESFVDFSVGYEHNTFLHNTILERYPHMCVMKSISKSYGVPGLRLGIFCSADIGLIAKMKKQVSIWNINSFAEFFMQIYPKYREDYKRACDEFIQARKDFEVELKKIPFIKVMPSQANYFFLEILPPYKPKELCTILLKKYNILASACLAKKGIEPNRYMRIAVRNHNDNEKFVQAMRELVKNGYGGFQNN